MSPPADVGTTSKTEATPGLLLEEFVPPDAAGERVGLLTPWPAPLYHDTPSLPVLRVGKRCTVKTCKPTVSRWPSRRPASVRYAPTGLCVVCHDRQVSAWKRTQGKRQEVPHAS